MSTLLQEASVADSTVPANRLRTTMAAVRLAFMWFGTRKTLTREQTAEAADAFGAEGGFVSAGKKLVDTRHPLFKAVTAARGRILSYWKGVSLPFPEPGIRLIRQDDITAFQVHLTTLKADLDEAVANLDQHFSELKTAARERLGRLYNASPGRLPRTSGDSRDCDWPVLSQNHAEVLGTARRPVRQAAACWFSRRGIRLPSVVQSNTAGRAAGAGGTTF